MKINCLKTKRLFSFLALSAFFTLAVGCVKPDPEPQPEPEPEPEEEVFETDLTFECNFADITDVSIKAEITPSANTEYYYAYLVSKEQFSTDSLEMDKTMKIFEQAAAQDGVSVEDVIKSRSKKGKSTAEFFELTHLTEYYLCIFQLNAEGDTGNFARFETSTASDIDKFSLDITVEDIACWTAKITVKSSDQFEKYLYNVVDKETFSKFKSDQEYIENYLKTNEVYIPMLLQKGESSSEWDSFYDDTEYYVLAFGYNLDEKKVTTSLIKKEFKTEPVSYIKDFSIDISVLLQPTSVSANLSAKPTASNLDASQLKYFTAAYKTSSVTEGNKDQIQSIIDKAIDDKCNRFPGYARDFIINTLLSTGRYTLRLANLQPSTEYTAFGVLLDRNGKIAGDIFTENFTTKEYIVSKASLDAELSAYYDGDEVVKLQQNALYPGNIIMKTVLTQKDSEIKEPYYTIALGDYTDTEKYTDLMLIPSIVSSSPSGIQVNKPIHLFTGWPKNEGDTTWTMLIVGLDKDNNYTKVIRKKYEITREGANPPEEFANRGNSEDVPPTEIKFESIK